MSRGAGHHEFGGRAVSTEPSSDRSFGLVFAGFFAIFASYNGWHGGATWPLYLGIAVAIPRGGVAAAEGSCPAEPSMD